MAKNDGGPVYPVEINHGSLEFPKITKYPGLSLRAYFAGQVTVTIEDDYPQTIEDSSALLGRPIPPPGDTVGRLRFWADVEATIRAIKADALIAELNKEE